MPPLVEPSSKKRGKCFQQSEVGGAARVRLLPGLGRDVHIQITNKQYTCTCMLLDKYKGDMMLEGEGERAINIQTVGM